MKCIEISKSITKNSNQKKHNEKMISQKLQPGRMTFKDKLMALINTILI